VNAQVTSASPTSRDAPWTKSLLVRLCGPLCRLVMRMVSTTLVLNHSGSQPHSGVVDEGSHGLETLYLPCLLTQIYLLALYPRPCSPSLFDSDQSTLKPRCKGANPTMSEQKQHSIVVVVVHTACHDQRATGSAPRHDRQFYELISGQVLLSIYGSMHRVVEHKLGFRSS
jgi:hypothetical protein